MSVDPDPDQTIALDDSNEHSLVEIDSSGSGHGSTGGAREWPASIKYIMGNEFCERFSFYGLKAILITYFVNYLNFEQEQAVGVVHAWIFAAYATAVLGGLISDAYLGKFKTILYLSLVYCLGSVILSITAIPGVTGTPPHWWGAVLALLILAVGTGGIKSSVSAFVGDQFRPDQAVALSVAFSMFYFMINAGSLISTILTPILRAQSYALAFGVPAILLLIATGIFFVGRHQYVKLPAGQNIFGVAYRTIKSAWREKRRVREAQKRDPSIPDPYNSFLDYAKPEVGEKIVQDLRSVLRVLMIFLPLPIFWSLFDQHSTRWVLQAAEMDLSIFGWFEIAPEHVQVLNPALMLLLLVVANKVVYPFFDRRGYPLRPFGHKMFGGMLFAALSFVISGIVQLRMDSLPPKSVSVWAIVPQFLVLGIGEVLVSVTGLETSYSEAPKSMKSIVMAAWLSTVAIGNAFVSIMAQIEAPSRAIDFFLFASLMILASSVFAFLLQFYTYRVPDDEELNGRADSDGTMPQLSVTEDNDTAEEY